MFELVAILTGTALASILAGFLWSRLQQKPTPRDWADDPFPARTYTRDE